MSKKIKIIFLLFAFLMHSCADYKTSKSKKRQERKYYSSSGFAIIINESFTKKNIIKKKLINNESFVLHSFLKRNTPVKLTNPDNLMSIDAKVYKNANYPKIFNVVVSKKISTILDLDPDNPYFEIIEYKINN